VAKGIMVVESEPGHPDQEAEYNRWYRDVHIPELLAVAGFVSVRRFKVRQQVTAGASPKPAYLTVYELEADDLDTPLNEMRRTRGERVDPDNPPPLSPSTVVTVYELVE
jgi:hypothetical protein